MTNAVTQVDKWFRNVDFNRDGTPDNFGFAVGKITIMSKKYRDYQLASEELDAKGVLDKLSLMAVDPYVGEFCLVVLFTHRDFRPKNYQGMAVYGRESAEAGVCANVTEISGKGKRRPNVAFVTNVNHGKLLTTAVIHVNLAHVLGHSLGAVHDDDTSHYGENPPCRSYEPSNWFLMNSVTHRPISKNNIMFSSCSLKLMLPVLRDKGSCFEYRDGEGTHECGDGLRQGEEECDCGDSAQCSILDSCCNPPSLGKDFACKLSRQLGSECSPMASACCDENCRIEKNNETTCSHDEDGCQQDSHCSGSSASCPPPLQEPDFKACQRDSRMCFKGKCTLSPCFYKDHRFEECTCKGSAECRACCLIDRECIPVARIGIYALRGKKFLREEGTPCAFGKGSCDREGICRVRGWDKEIDRVQDLEDSDDSSGFPVWAIILLVLLLLLLLLFVLCYFLRRKTHTKQMAHYHEIVESLYFDLSDVSPPELRERAARLWALFPSVPREEVVQVARENKDEPSMLSALIDRGYPVRKDFLRLRRLEHPKLVLKD